MYTIQKKSVISLLNQRNFIIPNLSQFDDFGR